MLNYISSQSYISDVRVTMDSKFININYRLNSLISSKYYNIRVSAFIDGKDYNLNNELGKNIHGGIGIQKTSDPIKNITFNSSQIINVDAKTVFLKLNARECEKFNSSNYYLKSMLVPGWGTGDLKNGKMNKFIAIGSYLLLGTGVGIYMKAKSDYNSYLQENKLPESDHKYSKAISELSIANYLFVGFGAVWVADLVRLKINLNKKKKTMECIDNKFYYIKDKNNIETTGCKIWLK